MNIVNLIGLHHRNESVIGIYLEKDIALNTIPASLPATVLLFGRRTTQLTISNF